MHASRFMRCGKEPFKGDAGSGVPDTHGRSANAGYDVRAGAARDEGYRLRRAALRFSLRRVVQDNAPVP